MTDQQFNDPSALDILFDPQLDFPIDTLQESPQGVGSGTDQPAAAPDSIGSVVSGLGGGLGGDIAVTLLGIAGAGSLAYLLSNIKRVVGDVKSAIDDVEKSHPVAFLGKAVNWLATAQFDFVPTDNQLWSWIKTNAIDQLFESMLQDGLKLNVAEVKKHAPDAVQTVNEMLSFAIVMEALTAAINGVGRVVLGERWSEGFGEILSKIPEEMGISWALGLVINQAFEGALGASLTEAINLQKRPSRIEWPQIRLLLKQHKITPDEFTLAMQLQGFPDEQIAQLSKLQDVQVPVGDIAQLWYREVIGGDTALGLIKALGFSDEQANWLYDLYVDKSENEATVTLRTTARRMFENNLQTEAQYRAILTAAHFPSRLIEEDVAAINLEQEYGRVLTGVSAIKQLYQHGKTNADGAKAMLRELNYSPLYAGQLVQTWDLPKLHQTHGLSQSLILRYLVAGLIKPDDATTRLVSLGLNPDDAAFLVAHPKATPGTTHHQLTTGLVTEAYTDKVLADSQLEQAYRDAGATDEALPKLMAVARYRLAHKRGSGSGEVPLPEADMKAAFKNGLIDFNTLVSWLETVGYSHDNALLIAEIENKGPFVPASSPIFNNVDQAIAYMQGLGFTIYAPTSQQLLAAEALLSANGYTWTGGPTSPAPLPTGGGPVFPPVPSPIPNPQPPGPHIGPGG